MEAVGGVSTGPEARAVSRPARLIDRVTPPLGSLMSGRYLDTLTRSSAPPAQSGAGFGTVLTDAYDRLVGWLDSAISWAWKHAKATKDWVVSAARSVTRWVGAAVSRAFASVTRTDERRARQEAEYERKYQEGKYLERKDAERREDARRLAAADAAAVSALATDRVRPAPVGFEKYQIVDNGSLERRRMRRVLTGMLPA